MADKIEIKNIEQLRLEKEKVKMEMKITQQALKQNFRRIGDNARNFAISKFLLPAGLTAVATYVINNWSGEKAADAQMSEARPPLWQGLITHLAEFVLTFFQATAPRKPEPKEEETPAT